MRPKLEGVLFLSIFVEAQRWLERDFEEVEAERALMEYGSDKAPGLDGFNFCFIKARWDFLKRDFVDMLKEFHQRGRLNKAINATFFTLIPKEPNPMDL